jgi:hypothetical protein
LAFCGVARVTVALLLLELVSVTEFGETAQFEWSGPPLQLRESVPLNPLSEVRVNT